MTEFEGLKLQMDALRAKKISAHFSPAKVKEDLQKFREMAMELGADAAEVIPASEIIIDERVRAKCIYPKCEFYGSNMNCPPHAPDLDFMRKLVARYRFGVLFCVKGETADFSGGEALNRVEGKNRTRRKLSTICTEIESRAFYEGYYLALAFGQGPCKNLWCHDEPCAGLGGKRGCRFPLKSRSSLEAVGIDAFLMVASKGWEIYPCGARVDSEGLPHVLLIGLVLIV